jgi:hypothetical protein
MAKAREKPKVTDAEHEVVVLFGRRLTLDELMAAQKIDGPQGLDSFGFEEWTDSHDVWLKAMGG